MAKHAEMALIDLISGGDTLVAAAIAQQADAMRHGLVGPSPSPLEELSAQRIVACWLQLQHTEIRFLQSQKDVHWARYWLARQAQSDRLFRGAVRSLGTIRQLLVPTAQAAISPPMTSTPSVPAAKSNHDRSVPGDSPVPHINGVNRLAGLVSQPDAHPLLDATETGKPKLNGFHRRLEGLLEPIGS